FFLAAQSMAYKYKNNNRSYDGKAKLRRIIRNGGEDEEYFIGCDK
ncbi:15553_t:CDS:1, partial [Funneliformis caledonium]